MHTHMCISIETCLPLKANVRRANKSNVARTCGKALALAKSAEVLNVMAKCLTWLYEEQASEPVTVTVTVNDKRAELLSVRHVKSQNTPPNCLQHGLNASVSAKTITDANVLYVSMLNPV